MADIVELKKKRTTIKAKATRFKNTIEACIVTNETIYDIESRIEKLDLLWDEFNDVQHDIDALLPAPEISERETFENAFFATQNLAKRKIAAFKENRENIGNNVHRNMVGNTNNDGGELHARLPVITLPTFDGSYDKWQSFYDKFLAMVHRNAKVDIIGKFHYLESALTGKAKEYVSSFEITEENYPIVLDLLRKRYYNSRLTINHHVHQLFNLPMVTGESAVSLRALADGLQKHTRILEQLKEPVDKWDTLLLYLASTRLDKATKRDWELKIISDKLSKISDFIEFIETRCQMLEAMAPPGNHSSSNSKTVSYQGQKREGKSLTHFAAGEPSAACAVCNQNHRIYSCSTFLEYSVDERREKIKELRLCFNCLGFKHTARECKSTRFCKYCNSTHHSLLHKGSKSVSNNDNNSKQLDRKNENQGEVGEEASGKSTQSSVYFVEGGKTTTEKLLSTAEIYIRDNVGQLIKARALLDNGSMANFMTKRLCTKLRLREKNVHHTVSGINSTQTNIMSCASTIISSTHNNYQVRAEFFVMENISQCIPIRKINVSTLSIPDRVKLADPEFHNPQPVDLLLGTAIFWDSLEPTQIRQGQGHPVLQLTKFGWILGGYLTFPEANGQQQSTSLFCGLVTNATLNDQMEKFWRINEGPIIHHRSVEEQKCEQVFAETWKRTSDGKFEVDILLREDHKELGDSRTNAEKRLLAMERRFARDPTMKERYHQNLDDFLEQGHMVLHSEQTSTGKNYLPHHAVVKESSTTTKLRVVWDASCKTSTGISLNDCLMTGPVVQQELFLIIIRFRQHRFVITGDIVKMYRQIWIKPEQRNLQCILWRKDPSQPMMTYQLNTVTFGVTSSPYLATRCLVQLAEELKETNPRVSRVIKNDFYVDDVMTGADTEEEVDTITEEVTTILKGAGLELQKIYTNKIKHNDDVQGRDITEIKTLGLRWQPGADCWRYQSSYEPEKGALTKRGILSAIAQVFDPLGLIGPFVMRSKLLLQHLWKLKIGWDTPVPQDISEKWREHCDQLRLIGRIKIPRHALTTSPEEIEIHGFCDASQVAYGACIYLRSTNSDGSVLVRLLTARSRVSPIKTVSLPRLELCGAQLLANLYTKVKEGLTVEIRDAVFWSDSTVALAWIKGDPSRWHTFVGNRVSEIQQTTSTEKWNHVRTDQNPADLISRGADLNELENSDLWWSGPSWLSEEKEKWPHDEIEINEVPEEKKVVLAFSVVERDFSILRRFSSWSKLCRVTAYCQRYIGNLSRKKRGLSAVTGCLSVDELTKARITLLKLHQEEEFSKELIDLRRSKPINTNSSLLTFNPFLDEEGLIRVGGRLANAPISYSQKFPIILSKNHMITELIIRDCHYKNLHAGSRFLKGILRENYWIVSAEGAIRRVLRKCILCFRLRPKSPSQLMGDLPVERVTASRAFAHTGLDYAGPFKIKISRNVTGKAYLCVFVCMAVKAVHLELVSDLSTNAFLNALKRFIARRGKCLSLSSDNGTNFIGAKNELREIVTNLLTQSESKSRIENFVAENSIKWNFIPPYSPHMGGLWEAAVKSAKSHLRAVINDTLLTFEELYTVIAQVESILNSRPLFPQSSDPNDLSVLTPGHFLIGTTFNSILEENHLEIPLNRLNRFQLLCQMQQSFWKRWSCEYLTQLQSRSKWKQESENVRVGQMIVIKDDNAPPLRWQLGRIVELHFGADGRVRVVSIRMSSGIVKRALPKICVLPIETDK